jgi:hypothetical protein
MNDPFSTTPNPFASATADSAAPNEDGANVEPEAPDGSDAESGPDPSATRTAAQRLVDGMADALKKGKEDATEAARQAAPKIKEGVNKGAYSAAYGLSFGASFGLTLLREILPASLKDGFASGCEAGMAAAKKALTPKPKPTTAEQEAAAGPIIDAEPNPAPGF